MNLLKQIQLPNGQSSTNLGFGCGSLLRIPSALGREALLRTVFEEGITHFDVARMYASGEAEGMVGTALKSLRDHITVATKFGLPYTPAVGALLNTQSLAKWFINKSPTLKNTIRLIRAKTTAASRQPATPNVYSREEMEKSLELSLTQLQTDRVEMLFLHSPCLNDIIKDDLAAALQEKKAEGKIGCFGISGYRPEMEHFLKERPEVCGDAIQYQFSVLENGPESGAVRYPFTNMCGLLDGPVMELHQFLARNKSFAKSSSEKLGIDLRARENLGIIILAMALVMNPRGQVIFFTSDAKRLQRVVRGLTENSFSEEGLLDFQWAVVKGMMVG
jgi:D-threo-aldose 1-dehydrogenase